MQRRTFLTLGLGGLLLTEGCAAPSHPYVPINVTFDPETARRVTALTTIMPEACGTQERFDIISQHLLKTPYKENHLIGSQTQKEQLIVDLNYVDCLSFLEYALALNKSTTIDDFLKEIITTRYINGIISFRTRRHFFTDWSQASPILGEDITHTLSTHTVTSHKVLNQKPDNTFYLPGILPKKRQVTYLPNAHLQDAFPLLRTGDMVGIYTSKIGLDVTHTGTVIQKDDTLWFRNASSLQKNRCVVDTVLENYLAKKPGIVVIRPYWSQ